jgi:hypothetical protein
MDIDSHGFSSLDVVSSDFLAGAIRAAPAKAQLNPTRF